MTLELRRTCRCGHLRAQHDTAERPCRACACPRYDGGLVVVLAVRAKEPAARVVVPDEVPDPPAPYVRRAHSAGTGGVDRGDRPDGLTAAGLLATTRTGSPLLVGRERE